MTTNLIKLHLSIYSDKAKRVRVQIGNYHAVLDLEKNSITTAEFSHSP